jgi:hypothetical protein
MICRYCKAGDHPGCINHWAFPRVNCECMAGFDTVPKTQLCGDSLWRAASDPKVSQYMTQKGLDSAVSI